MNKTESFSGVTYTETISRYRNWVEQNPTVTIITTLTLNNCIVVTYRENN